MRDYIIRVIGETATDIVTVVALAVWLVVMIYLVKRVSSLERSCSVYFLRRPDVVEPIIEKCAKEHLIETRRDDFFNKHPYAIQDTNGMPTVCAHNCGYVKECPRIPCADCWNAKLNETKRN